VLPDLYYSSRGTALAVLPDGAAWVVRSAAAYHGPDISLVEFHAGAALVGDVDDDGDTDLGDLALLLANYGT